MRSPGRGDGDPVGHRRHRVGSGHRPAGGERAGERGGPLGLHGDHPDVRTAGLDRGRDPRDQAPAPGADDDRGDVRALVEDLQADRALPGDDVGVLEGVDEHRSGPLGVLGGGHERLGEGLPAEPDLGAVGAGGRDLGQRRGLGHEDGGRSAQQPRGQRHALRVVAGAGGDDPAGPLGVGQPRDARVGAADLERAGALQVLALEPHRAADPLGQRAGVLQRRAPDDAGEQFGRRLDVGTADQGAHQPCGDHGSDSRRPPDDTAADVRPPVDGRLAARRRRDPDGASRRTVVEVTDPATPATPPPAPTTLGELRATGAAFRPVKAELRANLLARLGAGEPSLPGMVGFEDTVVPEVERALIAGHDLVLLGERGQGKTRLIRTLIGLLDEWTPVLVGSELNEHPLHPISVWAHRQIAEHGDATPVGWLHRSDRFGEKLATPDTSVGDLIGDVDPIKVAEGRTLGDPETVHYGLVPRTNRGIFSVNELPDLAERIQVALLNVLEERDIQIRGYRVRLPLDLLLVASANPEDYTNRGRIITPLKDRFGAEVRTHYPLELADEIRLLHQEAQVSWNGRPTGTARSTPRSCPSTWPRSSPASPGWSASPATSTSGPASAPGSPSPGWRRSTASAVRRAAISGETRPVARVVDLPCVVPASRGKVEFADSGADPDDDREIEMLEHLLRQATAQTFRARCAGLDLTGLQEHFTGGETVESGELVPAPALLGQLGTIPNSPSCSAGSGCRRASSPPSRRPPRSSSPSRGCT